MLWTEAYRPKRVADAILNPAILQIFEGFIRDGFAPNLLLSGPPGVGKTSVAKAFCEEIGADWYYINASMNRNIETLRVDIADFASGVSLTGNRKYVILDEADFLNPHSTQPALRGFMEEYAENCGFILTCNWPQKVIEPLHSRLTQVDFRPVTDPDQKAKLSMLFFKRVQEILDKENISYEKQVLAKVVYKYFPDWRKVLNVLQGHAAQKKMIDASILAVQTDANLDELVAFMKAKNFTSARKWVGENSGMTPVELFRKLYDSAHDIVEPSSVPQLVTIVAEYLYRSAFVADQEVNTAACVANLMAGCDFR